MASVNIDLPAELRNFLQSQVEGGRYASVSDYVSHLIESDMHEQATLAQLHDNPRLAEQLEEGLSSGSRKVDATFFDELRAQIRERHSGHKS